MRTRADDFTQMEDQFWPVVMDLVLAALLELGLESREKRGRKELLAACIRKERD